MLNRQNPHWTNQFLLALILILALVLSSSYPGVSWVALVVRNLPANAGDERDSGLTPGLGRPPREGHGNPLQYSCLENPMDRGACQAMAHRLAKNQTRRKWLSTHAQPPSHITCKGLLVHKATWGGGGTGWGGSRDIVGRVQAPGSTAVS